MADQPTEAVSTAIPGPEQPSAGVISDEDMLELVGPELPGDAEPASEEPGSEPKPVESKDDPPAPKDDPPAPEGDGQAPEAEPAPHNVDKGMDIHLQKSQQVLAETQKALAEMRTIADGLSDGKQRQDVTDLIAKAAASIEGNEEAFIDDKTKGILDQTLNVLGEGFNDLLGKSQAAAAPQADLEAESRAKAWITENLKIEGEDVERVYASASARMIKLVIENGGYEKLKTQYGEPALDQLGETYFREAAAGITKTATPPPAPPTPAPPKSTDGTTITAPGSTGQPGTGAPSNLPAPVGAEGVLDQYIADGGVVDLTQE